MLKFEKRFLENIQVHSLLKPGERLLIGLSGGSDSMALLHALLSIKPLLDLELWAAHYNFKLRERESDEDAAFCKAQCHKAGVELFTSESDTRAYAAETKQSIETSAREIRYRFFDEIMNANQLNRLVTAHHANDNAETILFNLFRGSSLLGLKGIPLSTEKVLRPLLFFTKSELMAYIHEKKVPYCTDNTNDLLDADRNYIRHKVIPLIEERFEHKLIPNLMRLSENGRELESFVDGHIRSKIKTLHIDFTSQELSVTALNRLSLFEKKEIFKRWLKHLGLDPNSKRLSQLCGLLETQPGRKVVLTKQLTIVWKGKWLKADLQKPTPLS